MKQVKILIHFLNQIFSNVTCWKPFWPQLSGIISAWFMLIRCEVVRFLYLNRNHTFFTLDVWRGENRPEFVLPVFWVFFFFLFSAKLHHEFELATVPSRACCLRRANNRTLAKSFKQPLTFCPSSVIPRPDVGPYHQADFTSILQLASPSVWLLLVSSPCLHGSFGTLIQC